MIPMKWFKFLIYFALWAGAAMNVLNGIAFLTGASYGDMKELVYAFYKDSQTIGIVVGIASIALGVLDIAARFSLAKYKKAGPKLLTSVYAGAIAVNLIYVIGTIAVLPQMIVEELNYTNAISGCVMGAVMIVVDHIYFKKRSHLFIN